MKYFIRKWKIRLELFIKNRAYRGKFYARMGAKI